MNLGRLLTHTATLYPQHTALIQGEQSWTWSEINARVDAMVAALRELGLKKGDRILLQSRNNIQTFENCWTAFKLGCVWVPTNFRLTPPEVAYLGASSGAVAMIVEDLFHGHTDAVKAESKTLKHVIVIGQARAGELSYEALVAKHLGSVSQEETVHYDDPLWFFYTSGTTGKPKAGILTHGQMAFVVTNHLAEIIPGTTERDCSIAVAPLSHGAGIHALLNVARGAATILMSSEKFDPELFWQLVERYRVSNLFTVPTIVKMLVEHPAVDQYDHSSLRYMVYAGAPMYRADQKRALEKLGKVIVQYFGLGEVTGNITVLPPEMHSADDHDENANVVSSLAITAILKPLKRRSGVAGFIPAISEKWMPADCYTSQDVNPICIFRVALTYTLAKSKRYYSRILLWLKSPLLGCQTPSGARSAWPWW